MDGMENEFSHHITIWSLIMIATWLDYTSWPLSGHCDPSPVCCDENDVPRLGMHSQNVRNSDSFHAPVNLRMNRRRNWKFDFNILTFLWTPQETRLWTMNAFHSIKETKDVFPIKMWTTCKMKILSPAEEWMECNVRIKSEVYESASLFWPSRLWPVGP